MHREVEQTNRRDDRERRGRRKKVLGEFLPLSFDDAEIHYVLVSVVVVRAHGASGTVGRPHEADDEGSAAVQTLSFVDSRAEGRAGRST